ncbi:phosphoglycerate kinase [Cohnella kolymensis]|uniref:Phosphoglycerate kinase n=1 Tax=Cohnella kolymensis TaxID=1590652 RepID=A0ABR5A1F8_9BACL|nr:histidine phosphatase family protein [Cohnella kolymensis]KIL34821.1 phosphoglycerate kinase [Cohnella kolymensis]
MMKPTRIGWIRHGVTEWNRLGKIQGVTDIPLSSEGINQARLLADRLVRDGESWDGIMCSDLTRAVQTAQILADSMGIPLIEDSRLRERYFGQAEGTTEQERLARWGADWRNRVPDQETDLSIVDRGMKFVEELTLEHAGEAWLVVTHGSFLARLLKVMCKELDDSYLLNMSLSILQRQEQGWQSLLHNCTIHLNDIKANS